MMKNIELVIDTATDLPEDIIREYHIRKVELNVAFGGVDYTGISNKEFYEMMRTSLELPKTSASSPERYMEQYKYDADIVMLTLTRKLSSSYSNANLAKEMYLADHSHKEIEVVDTTNGCIGSGLLAIMVGEMIKAGNSFAEVVKNIYDLRDRIIHYGLLETLDNAVKGGRVSKAKGMIANALNLKPIVEISDGLVKPYDKARGTKNGLKKLTDIIVNNIKSKGQKYSLLGIAHANAYDKAILIRDEILSRSNFDRVIISEIGPLMGTYTAEGAVMVAAL
ncbi:MAG: DegV family protein [Peptostreptococcaceae bacterium]|nr:DegV family protein [Peptostreptococcaceae bacterium]